MTSDTDAQVSIVIPAYQAGRYLPETLEGVTLQTWSDWELILVEDGSRDETRMILEKFAKGLPGHRVVYHNTIQNHGQGHARNVAISMAKGRYIALLDSDDVWTPDYLSTTLKVLLKSGADIAYSTSALFDHHSGAEIGHWGPESGAPPDIQSALARNSFLTPSATVIRKDLFERIGGFDESEALRNVEDYDFWLRAAAGEAHFEYVGGCRCRYRKGHDDAATRDIEHLNFKLAQVLEKNIDQLTKLDQSTRDKLHARRLFIAGMHNIKANTEFAQMALKKAWRLDRSHVLYAFGFLASYFPRLLYCLRELAIPMKNLWKSR
jgi:glycosyltransferase involved in cell wall biosynthesis